jgi:hypothetical protein
MSDLVKIIKDEMAQLDYHTKDYLSSEDYISKCRFAFNVLLGILVKYEKRDVVKRDYQGALYYLMTETHQLNGEIVPLAKRAIDDLQELINEKENNNEK